MNAKRYNFEYYDDAPHDSGMEVEDDGWYVEYSEYDKLLDLLARAKNGLDPDKQVYETLMADIQLILKENGREYKL